MSISDPEIRNKFNRRQALLLSVLDPVRGQTMVFDNVCRMADDPEGDVRKILS